MRYGQPVIWFSDIPVLSDGRSGQYLTTLADSMEAGLDRQWLVGEPRWRRLPDDSSQQDAKEGELTPPESWLSTTAQ